jgi:hypothetical protein
MKSLLVALLAVFAVSSAAADDHAASFTIQSLHAPDPAFVTSGDGVEVRVTAAPAPAISSARVSLNGADVTSALAIDGAGALAGTVSGLRPGLNVLQVFHSNREHHAVARLTVAKAVGPAVPCAAGSFAGVTFPVPNTVISAVTPVAANATTPAHCLVTGTIDAGRVGAETSPGAPVARYTYAIGWAARLPDAWNSKFYMPGGGGLDGSVPNTAARLAMGYAEAASDSGHNNAVNNDPLAAGTGSFATDFPARVNFAHRAIDVTTQTGKALVAAYYGVGPVYSYFQGCSMGGREAMMVTEKLPTYFDGAIAGDPGFKFTAMTTHEVYDAQLLAALATAMGLTSAVGLPLANNTFTNQDLQLVSKAILDACDALDGLVDGMVNAFERCTTRQVMPRLRALACAGAKDPTCLLPAQLDALLMLYAGAPTYYPWSWDPGIAGCTSAVDCNTPTATNIAAGWRAWKIGSYQTNPATAVNNALDFTGGAGGAAITILAPTPPMLPAPVANEGVFDIVTHLDQAEYARLIHNTTSAFPVSSFDLLEVDSPDRSAFREHGGKLIITQPQSGGPFSPLAMVDWYRQLNRYEHGNRNDFTPARRFARLFMQPGAQHCGGGPSTSSFDALPYLVDWVENGNAPERILSTAPAATPWPKRTRPLCSYPAYAHYVGSGSIEDAANFVCAVDPGDE